MIRGSVYQVGLKVEAAEGTKETLAAGDFITAHNAKFTPDIKMAEDKSVTGTMSKVANKPGLRSGKISFDIYLRGGSGAGVAPEYGPALRACGVKETVVAATSVTYTPAPRATTVPSVTVELRVDGKICRIWGARGTAKFKGMVGELAIFSLEFYGADWEKIDGAQMAGVSYTTIPTIIFMNAAMTLAGSGAGLNLGSLDIDLGAKVVLRKSVNTPSGYVSGLISDRNPTLSFDPEEVLASEINYFGDWQAGTTMAFSTGALGSGAGQVCTITAPALQYQGISESETDGLSTLQVNSKLCKNAGDDEYSIAFT